MRERCLVVGIDEVTAIRYAEAYSALERQGRMIPINDIWIAAFAIRHQMPILANDGHFDHVEGLDLIAL